MKTIQLLEQSLGSIQGLEIARQIADRKGPMVVTILLSVWHIFVEWAATGCWEDTMHMGDVAMAIAQRRVEEGLEYDDAGDDMPRLDIRAVSRCAFSCHLPFWGCFHLASAHPTYISYVL